MTRRAVALHLAVAWLAAASGAAAQTPGEPRLFLSVFGGYRSGQQLWVVNDQPFAVLVAHGDSAVPAGGYDTLDLVRRFNPGFVVGAAGAYFPEPTVGFEAEVVFLGMSVESRCAIRQAQPPQAGDLDPELCLSLLGQSVPTSAVSLSLGVVGRVNPGGTTSPYVRLDAGLIARTRSTIELTGTFADANGLPVPATVVEDSRPRTTDVHVSVGAGLALAEGKGYQLRVEGRDVIARVDRVTGLADPSNPATGALAPPHGGRFFHNLVFTVALDVIFEKRRGRRY